METVTLSYEELDRVSVLARVIEKRLTQCEAARMLGLTSRQVRRLAEPTRATAPGLASSIAADPAIGGFPELRREALATRPLPYEGFGRRSPTRS